MLNFISFGSGSSGNCYLLYTDDDALLIDAGVGVRLLKKHFHDYGLRLDKVRNILVTHDHADHVKSVGSISGDYHIPVFATRKVHNGIERNYCVRRKIDADMLRIITVDEPFTVGEFRVTAFEVPHDSSDNVGYLIEYGDVTFCLMTDVGHLTPQMLDIIGKANYLVIEANHDPEMLRQGPYPQYLKDRIMGPRGHLNNTECARALAEHATEKLRHVWLCHLSEENNHPELARLTVEQVLRDYGLVVGKDFAVDVLKRKTPSEVYELK
ncbi:MAG: MBL fold metallo-hydrolase [Prevotellaceae bacterium]|nr:MBL fold metallo-hydrolase [Prevotellaceae bacterium]